MTIVDRSTHFQNRHLTFRANMGVGRHGWLRLTPAYSVKLVRDKIAQLDQASIITDPFSGTGTTPLAAAELGHFGQSIDINPFLQWLGTVKTTNYPEEALLATSEAGVEALRTARREVREADLWQPDLFKIDRWWTTGNLQALKSLRVGIDAAPEGSAARNFLDIALCRTLIARSNAAFNHQSMSFRSTDSTVMLFDADEADETFRHFEAQVADLVESARLDLVGSGRVVLGDSSKSLDGLAQCDLLLTSPPYVNRMSYIRELRPYMYWLKFLDRGADAGELDWRTIGGTWGTATSKLNGWKPSYSGTPVDEEMNEVRGMIATTGGKNGPLLSNYVGKYFDDMWHHFEEAYRHVKSGGRVSYIVGNSTFYGNVVPAQDWYAKMLSALGFIDVRVEIIRKRNSNKALFEYDVTGRKP